MIGETRAKPSKSAEAYDRLRDLIHAGKFDHGQRLSESAAARLLKMGRGPIRDSLLRLETEGLLGARGKRRSRVVMFTEDEDQEKLLRRYEVREQVESGATRLAAKNMNGWQIDTLRKLAEQVERFRLSGEAAARYEASGEFHRYLMTNCGNALLLEIWDKYRLAPARPRTVEFEQRILSNIPEAEREKPTLVEMVDAIAAHDQDRAERLMKERIRKITEAIRATVWEQTTNK